MTLEMDRRTFLRRSAVAGAGAAAAAGPLGILGTRAAHGRAPARIAGYGAPVPKPPLVPAPGAPAPGGSFIAIPPGFEYVVLDRQGTPMRSRADAPEDRTTPGIFDGMGAFAGPGGRTILIRNHENREREGEIDVVPPGSGPKYDPAARGGNTKVIVEFGEVDGHENVPQRATSYPVLGGTSTNCAGGQMPWGAWVTCEEVVKAGHGYVFEIPVGATGPIDTQPIHAAGRFAHEAVVWHAGVLYETEDRGESAFYRYVTGAGRGATSVPRSGRLEALKLRGVDRADMNTHPEVGRSYKVEWVPVPVPDHTDDSDSRTAGPAGNPDDKPTRLQAFDRGAAVFDRLEGAWLWNGRVYFDCTEGGREGLGQVFEYDPASNKLTLIYESGDAARLESPDNVVIVPGTGDILLQEDGDGEQFVRGLTQEGEIYDFVRTVSNTTEFCGGCFDPAHEVLYLNQQGERGELPEGPPDTNAITYAIFGPFSERRARTR